MQTYLKTLNISNAVSYILSSVCLKLSHFSQLSLMWYVGLCNFSLPISLVMTENRYTFSIFYMLNPEYQMVRNQYSQLLFTNAFVPICLCKNNRRIWRHNANTSCLHDITDQLWWRHNDKSEKTVLGDNGKLSDPWLFQLNCVLRTKHSAWGI